MVTVRLVSPQRVMQSEVFLPSRVVSLQDRRLTTGSLGFWYATAKGQSGARSRGRVLGPRGGAW